MLKHIVALIVLAIVVILATPQVHALLEALVAGHDWIADTLKAVFSGGRTGSLLRDLIASLTIPLLVGFIPAGLYWLARRSFFPYFMTFVWVTWLVQTSALIMVYKAATAS